MSEKKPNVWVGPNPSGSGWQVKPEGKKPVATTPTQREGIARGRPLAERNGSDLVIQRPDGTIRERDSHGNESKSPDKNGKKK
jgi:hypothetical protein